MYETLLADLLTLAPVLLVAACGASLHLLTLVIDRPRLSAFQGAACGGLCAVALVSAYLAVTLVTYRPQ